VYETVDFVTMFPELALRPSELRAVCLPRPALAWPDPTLTPPGAVRTPWRTAPILFWTSTISGFAA